MPHIEAIAIDSKDIPISTVIDGTSLEFIWRTRVIAIGPIVTIEVDPQVFEFITPVTCVDLRLTYSNDPISIMVCSPNTARTSILVDLDPELRVTIL